MAKPPWLPGAPDRGTPEPGAISGPMDIACRHAEHVVIVIVRHCVLLREL